LKVWPNPFSDKIRITSAEPIQRLEVFDLSGKLLLSKSLNNLHTNGLNLLEISSTTVLKATFVNGTSKSMVLVKKP